MQNSAGFSSILGRVTVMDLLGDVDGDLSAGLSEGLSEEEDEPSFPFFLPSLSETTDGASSTSCSSGFDGWRSILPYIAFLSCPERIDLGNPDIVKLCEFVMTSI